MLIEKAIRVFLHYLGLHLSWSLQSCAEFLVVKPIVTSYYRKVRRSVFVATVTWLHCVETASKSFMIRNLPHQMATELGANE